MAQILVRVGGVGWYTVIIGLVSVQLDWYGTCQLELSLANIQNFVSYREDKLHKQLTEMKVSVCTNNIMLFACWGFLMNLYNNSLFCNTRDMI